MENIINYLINEKNQKPQVAEKVASPFGRHDDIRAELEEWITHRRFPATNPITVEGYTAAAIVGLAQFMDGVGAYNFLITLRERPENGKRIISEGFPRK